MFRLVAPLCVCAIDCAGVRCLGALVETRSTLIATELRGLEIDGELREETPEDTLPLEGARWGYWETGCDTR